MKKLTLLFFVLFSLHFHAQISETLSSDRPGQALSSSVVGKKVFQLQPGLDYFKTSDAFVPNAYFRYGISDNVEFNTNLAYAIGNGTTTLVGFSLGSRISLSNENNSTSSALQLSFVVPVENLQFNSQAIYTIAGTLFDNLGWTANLGANFDKDFNTTGLYVFNLSYSISDKVGAFVEPFGTFINNNNFAFDTGVYYLLNNNLQLDAAVGNNNGFFISFGATVRILPKK